MGNTGHEGLHMAALGAAWQAVVFGMAGLWAQGGKLTAEPMLPPAIRRVKLHVYHRGKRFALEATHAGATIREEA
jgi:trehalose/maltose hydrolase-like predicted phosphorylase